MIFPAVVPGQGVDEIQGLPSGGYLVTTVTSAIAYTVPAGFTALIHGYFIQMSTLAASSGTLAINGLIVGAVGASVAVIGYGVDRHKMYPTGANSQGLAIITESSGSATSPVQGQNALISSTGGPAAAIVAEHAPFLFQPLAAGTQIVGTQSTGTCSITAYFLISLHPN